MDLISGLAELVIKASAIASAVLVDAAIVGRLFGKDIQADALAVKSIALILLFIIAFSVKVVMG